MKSFLVTSSGTFLGIISADNASRTFEAERNAERQWYENREKHIHDQEVQGLSFVDRAIALARQEKYKIIGATWVASMVGSFALVGRNPYMSGSQKIVQARVYAQGLTLAVLVASAGFEISDQKKGRGIMDASKAAGGKKAAAGAPPAGKEDKAEEGGDLWKDMVAAEEDRLKKKHQSLYDKPHQENGEEGASEEQQGEKKTEQKTEQKGEQKSEQGEKKEGGEKKGK